MDDMKHPNLESMLYELCFLSAVNIIRTDGGKFMCVWWDEKHGVIHTRYGDTATEAVGGVWVAHHEHPFDHGGWL
jgi:hypothetical protein